MRACSEIGTIGLDLPDFRIAHQPITKADSQTVGLQGARTVVFGNGIHVGSVSSHDSIPFFDVGYTPPIVHTEAPSARVAAGLLDLHQADFILNFGHSI